MKSFWKFFHASLVMLAIMLIDSESRVCLARGILLGIVVVVVIFGRVVNSRSSVREIIATASISTCAFLFMVILLIG